MTQSVTVNALFGAIDTQIEALGQVNVAGTVTSWSATKHRWARAEIACLDTNGNTLGKLSIGIPPNTNYAGGPVKVGADVVVTGKLERYPLYTPLQLRATSVTLIAEVAAPVNNLRQYLAQLDAKGQTAANKTRPVPDPIERVGLITPSSGGAGLNDPMSILQDSTTPMSITRYPVAMMGSESSRGIADEIRRATATNQVVLLCRGGGATADLVAFSSIEIVEAIVTSPIPVIAGIGHAHDSTAADLVGHTTTETPTAAAIWVLSSNRRSRDRVEQAELVSQQCLAAGMAMQGRRQIAQAVATETRADRRVRTARIVVAVLVVLLLVLVAAGTLSAGLLE